MRRAWNKRHGESHPVTPLYRAWRNMMNRCYYLKNYGGRGIGVEDSWRTYENFRDCIAPYPGKGWTLDRPRANENYGPDNWRWATMKMQRRNQRRTILTEEQEKEIIRRYRKGAHCNDRGNAKELAEEFGVNFRYISRLALIASGVYGHGPNHRYRSF